MIVKKKKFNLFLLLLSLLICIILKNYFICEYYFGHCVGLDGAGGDLQIYASHFNQGYVVVSYTSLIYVIFFLFQFLKSFEVFHLIFIQIFYIVIFFSGLKLLTKEYLWKYAVFIILVSIYPIYEGYSVNALKQGLGVIFMLLSIFIVKRVFSFNSWCLIIASSLSHYVFVLFYIIFYLSRFFSLKNLNIIFLLSSLIYLSKISDFFYIHVTKIINYINFFFVNDLEDLIFYVEPINEVKIKFILFSSLPTITLQIYKLKKYINKNYLITNLYKFHLLYSSFVYLFFSNYYYLDRFLSVSWIFYPFYFLYLFDVLKFNKR